jgi:hypothetical protein
MDNGLALSPVDRGFQTQSVKQCAFFSFNHGDNKLFFNERNTISWIFIVLDRWNDSPRIDMLLHSDILFRFRANQSLLFLLYAACLVEKQQIPIL